MKVARLIVGTLLLLASAAFLALTLVEPLICVGAALFAVILIVPHDQMKLAVATLAIVPTAGFALRTVNFGAPPKALTAKAFPDGEYAGQSADLLGLVSVRLRVAGGRIVGASAEAPSWLGLDAATLTREAARIIAIQAIPDAAAPGSDLAAATVTLAAFSRLESSL